jgi:hypothetical protein
MRALVLIAGLGCRTTETPPPALHNTALVVPAHPKSRIDRARAELARAYDMRAGGFLITAYAAAQGGLNILAGEPPDQDAELEASDTQAAREELRMMVNHRIHELEVKLGR